jgi:hypothetical protein
MQMGAVLVYPDPPRYSEKDTRHRGSYKTLPNNVTAFNENGTLNQHGSSRAGSGPTCVRLRDFPPEMAAFHMEPGGIMLGN